MVLICSASMMAMRDFLSKEKPSLAGRCVGLIIKGWQLSGGRGGMGGSLGF
jgi:hypothetical protein